MTTLIFIILERGFLPLLEALWTEGGWLPYSSLDQCNTTPQKRNHYHVCGVGNEVLGMAEMHNRLLISKTIGLLWCVIWIIG